MENTAGELVKRIDWCTIWKMEEFILLPAVDTMMTKFIAPSSFTVKVHHVFSNVGMIIESIINEDSNI